MDDRSLTLEDRFEPSSDRILIKPVKTHRDAEERLAHNEGVATSLYELCLLAIQTMIRLRDAALQQEQIDRLNEIAVDLRLWGGLTKTSEFEQCLASCTDIQHDVLSLLRDIGKCVQRLIMLQKPKISNELSKELSTDLSILIEKVEVVLDTDNDDEATIAVSGGHQNRNDDPLLEKVTEMLDEISSNIELLMEMTPTIEKTYAVTKVQPVLSKPDPEMISFRVSNEALPYVSLLRDKYPKATLELVERLGEANWQRFRRLRLQNEEPQSVIVSAFKPASTFHDSGVGSSLGTRLLGSHRPTDHISSNESLASSAGSDHIHRNRVPPEPSEVAEGESFTCQFCNQIQTNIRNRNDWKFHVFKDLQPYICTFENCSQMLSTFSNRKAWAKHEIESHLQTIEHRCLTCGMTFSSEDTLIRHHQKHTGISKGRQTVGIEHTLKTEYIDWKSVRCQLCHDQNFETSRQYTNHVAKHMEEVALVIIHQDEDSDSDSDSDKSSESQLDSTTRPHWNLLPSGLPTLTDGLLRPLPCPITFSTEVTAKAHMKMDQCDQNVKQKGITDPSHPTIAEKRDYKLDLAAPSVNESSVRPAKSYFRCNLCPKKFTREYNLRSHLRTHTDERPFVCSVCSKAFARQHDRKRHEGLHSGEKKFVCKGQLNLPNQTWGCGRRFARADALGRHFRTEAGRICIRPLLDQEAAERAQQGVPEQSISSKAPEGWSLPSALLAQYPALQNIDWVFLERQDGQDGQDEYY